MYLIDQRYSPLYTSPPLSPDGGIGRRGGFKIRFRKEWEFESPSGHHLQYIDDYQRLRNTPRAR